MGNEVYNNPTVHLIDYLASQGVMMQEDPFIPKGSEIKASEDVQMNDNVVAQAKAVEQTAVPKITVTPNVVAAPNNVVAPVKNDGLEMLEI